MHVGWFTTALRKREKKTVRKIIIYLNTFQYICTVTNPNPGGKKSTSKKKRLVKLSHLVEKVVKKNVIFGFWLRKKSNIFTLDLNSNNLKKKKSFVTFLHEHLNTKSMLLVYYAFSFYFSLYKLKKYFFYTSLHFFNSPIFMLKTVVECNDLSWVFR